MITVPVSDKVLRRRWRNKRMSVYAMRDNINRLKYRVREDLSSENEKERLTALIIRIMLYTGERIGNHASAGIGHFGISELKPRHVRVIGDKVIFDYIGKSGVNHTKQFTDSKVAALIKVLKQDNSRYLFETSGGFRIKASRVNRYLKGFEITSKDIRGFNSNKFMLMKLRFYGTVKEQKERKKIFNQCLRRVASKIGHTAATLRKHYLLPEIESDFYNTGSVSKINLV